MLLSITHLRIVFPDISVKYFRCLTQQKIIWCHSFFISCIKDFCYPTLRSILTKQWIWHSLNTRLQVNLAVRYVLNDSEWFTVGAFLGKSHLWFKNMPLRKSSLLVVNKRVVNMIYKHEYISAMHIGPYLSKCQK